MLNPCLKLQNTNIVFAPFLLVYFFYVDGRIARYASYAKKLIFCSRTQVLPSRLADEQMIWSKAPQSLPICYRFSSNLWNGEVCKLLCFFFVDMGSHLFEQLIWSCGIYGGRDKKMTFVEYMAEEIRKWLVLSIISSEKPLHFLDFSRGIKRFFPWQLSLLISSSTNSCFSSS